MAIPFSCPLSVAALVLWVAAPASACRRRQASNGVSPGRMNLVPCGTGILAPPDLGPGCGAAVVARDAGESATRSPVATGFVGVEMAPIRVPLTGFCRRDRLAGLRPSSRWSHRRIVSRPTSMPINRRPPTSDSADSPAWANRSNSSRCGSNWAVAWLRGCRAWATAWVSVVGRAVASGEWMGSDMGVDEALYAWWSGRARGAPRAQSKPKGLDVGVSPNFFLLFLLGKSGHLLDSFIGWFFGLSNWWSFHFRSLVRSLNFSFWFVCLIRLSGSSFFELGLVFGGVGC